MSHTTCIRNMHVFTCAFKRSEPLQARLTLEPHGGLVTRCLSLYLLSQERSLRSEPGDECLPLYVQSQEPAKEESPASALPPPAAAAAPAQAPPLPLLPFQMPNFEAPKFEKVQVPSFGTKQQEPSPVPPNSPPAPAAAPSPPPLPAAKVCTLLHV